MDKLSAPALISVPFADQGEKNAIPVDSQIGVTDGAASFTDGFPPLTMTPIAAGGIPPAGQDFNGILNAITQAVRWSCAGGLYGYDSSFSDQIGGYPQGSILQSAAGDILWLSAVDNNGSDPASGASWVPLASYGVVTVDLGAGGVTLTAEQAAKRVIILTGALTANSTLIFPSWVMSWLIVNNTTGDYAISVKTVDGAGVNLPSVAASQIYCDGENIYDELSGYLPLTGGTLTGELYLEDKRIMIDEPNPGAVENGTIINSEAYCFRLLGRGAFGDPAGATAKIYYSENVGTSNQIVIHINGFGNDIFFNLTGDGDLFIPRSISAGGSVYPTDYSNFDERYLGAGAAVVQDIQLGAMGSTGDIWGGGSLADHFVPDGCFMMGMNSTRDGDTIDIRNVYYKPVQKLINNTWVQVAG